MYALQSRIPLSATHSLGAHSRPVAYHQRSLQWSEEISNATHSTPEITKNHVYPRDLYRRHATNGITPLEEVADIAIGAPSLPDLVYQKRL
jgi:hypothetical protein